MSLATDIYLAVLGQYPRLGLPRRRAHVASSPPLRKRLRLCYCRYHLRYFLVQRVGVSRLLRRSRKEYREVVEQRQQGFKLVKLVRFIEQVPPCQQQQQQQQLG